MISQHIKEFSRHAHTYDEHTFVQKEVARYLVEHITSKPKRILDLGCGSGEVYKHITWPLESFVGVDCSEAMSERHPNSHEVSILCEDFESPLFKAKLTPPYDLIISSSALQWASDIKAMIEFVSLTCKEGAFAIFTDKTFQTLYKTSALETFLPSAQKLIALFEERFTCKHEIKTFQLYFDDTLSLFRYIKKSGVSGGQKKLSISQMRSLLESYPSKALEFEVLLVWGKPKI